MLGSEGKGNKAFWADTDLIPTSTQKPLKEARRGNVRAAFYTVPRSATLSQVAQSLLLSREEGLRLGAGPG